MVRTIIHHTWSQDGGGGVQMGFSIPIKFPSDWGGGGQSGQGLLALPPRCEIFLVRTLHGGGGGHDVLPCHAPPPPATPLPLGIARIRVWITTASARVPESQSERP